jgi:YVTN family beta-propeller protein
MLVVNSVLLPLTANSTVAVIDTKTNTIDDSITVERFPLAIATQPRNPRGDDNDGDNDAHDHDH